MSSQDDYKEVESVYTPQSDISKLILKMDSGEGQWVYTFYNDQIPDYLTEHARRNKEAEELDETIKLSRMVDQHLNPEASEDWRS